MKRAPSDTGVRHLLLTALAAALLCGLMQNAARHLARFAMGHPLDHGVHAWWMTPLGDSLLIIPVALLLAAVGTRFPWARATSFRFSILFVPIVLTALLLVGRLHLLAQLVLAVGVSVRLGTWLARLGAGRLVQRSVIGLLAVTAGVAIPVAVWPTIRERLDDRALGEATEGAPNVLVLLWDTVRARSLSLYGYELETTPFLTRFAAQGVVFDRAFSTASYTLPSHSSLFTGLWAHELAASWEVALEREPATLAEVFAAAGYRTGAFSANRLYVTREYGLGRGFSHFEEHRLGVQQVFRSSTLARAIATSAPVRDLLSFNNDLARVRAADHRRKLVPWLERDPRKPWFAFVNFMEAHTPYLPQPEYAQRFGWYAQGASRAERRKIEATSRREPEVLPPDVARHSQRAYEASIAELDAEVDVLLGDLRSRGLLDNTIVVITADHGEEFGGHGIFGHGNSLYVGATRVPLVMVFPGRIPAGKRVETTVSLRDVAATLVQLASVNARIPGRSLHVFWDAVADPREPVFAEIRYDPHLPASSQAAFGDVMTVIDDSMQVIQRGEDIFEAFDLAADPRGIAEADTLDARYARLRDLLLKAHAASGRGHAGGVHNPL